MMSGEAADLAALLKWAAVIWEDFDPETAEFHGEDEH